jgi:hypothetical protein
MQTATLKTVAARLPETFVITYQTERNNSLEGIRDFKIECVCSNLLLLSLFASFACFFVYYSFSCCVSLSLKSKVTNDTTKWKQQPKRYAIYSTSPYM